MHLLRIACAVLLLTWLPAVPAQAGAALAAISPVDANTAPLLLVHGFGDNCTDAFMPSQSTNTLAGNYPPKGQKGLADAATFLRAHGFGTVLTVGYYDFDPRYCDRFAPSSDSRCEAIPHTHVIGGHDGLPAQTVDDSGTLNDPIRHVACRLAWWIHDTYGDQPIRVLAHSMGGLLIRDAIGESGHNAPFPPALNVPYAVTVGSPHGGLGGFYLQNARLMATFRNLPTGEIDDMTVGSGFMNTIAALQAPQGSTGTVWGLIAGSQVCSQPGVPAFHPSCTETGAAITDEWPSGDGVIAAISALAMKADTKILYGELAHSTSLTNVDILVADPGTSYGHEWGTGDDSIGWVPGPFYLNDDSPAPTKAWICPATCSHTDMSDLNPLGAAMPADRALFAMARMLSPYTVGHTRHAGNDYPYDGLGVFGHQQLTDAWHQYDGQCDSFATWKVYENLGGTGRVASDMIPMASFSPADKAINPVVGYAGPGAPAENWGDARDWGAKARSRRYQVDDRPRPGAIAWWSDQGTGMPIGHVAYVTDVYADGSITIEQYNGRGNGQYSTLHLGRQGADDSSFGQPTWHVVWPTGFVHIADLLGDATAAPQPAPNPTYHHAHNTYGPGDGSRYFTLAGVTTPDPGNTHGWYTSTGHGTLGTQLWTNSHPGAEDSTATWDPPLTAQACYAVDAFVPDTYSNNRAALYRIIDRRFGTSLVPVNENLYTNDFTSLGVFQATDAGQLTVSLTDQGETGAYVAADALRFTRQPDCLHLARTSLTVDRLVTDSFHLEGTTYGNGDDKGWYRLDGKGQRGNALWTYAGGTVTQSSAVYNPLLLPNDCYQVMAYVPDARSNNYQAAYEITNRDGTPTVTVDENAFTNGQATLGTYYADAAGHITVRLTDQGTGGTYTAADTISFVHTTCAAGYQGRAYPPLIQGPGSPLRNFDLAKDWYNQFGRGYLGYAKWTHTNGTTAESVATWTFTGLTPNACYQIDTYIPDAYANNPSAVYRATTSMGNLVTTVHQDTTTGWTPLGLLLPGSDGTLTVRLDDTGSVGTYTSADAVRLTRVC